MGLEVSATGLGSERRKADLRGSAQIWPLAEKRKNLASGVQLVEDALGARGEVGGSGEDLSHRGRFPKFRWVAVFIPELETQMRGVGGPERSVRTATSEMVAILRASEPSALARKMFLRFK